MLRLHRVSEISSGGTDSIAIMIPGADATPEAAVVNAESKRAAAVKAAAASMGVSVLHTVRHLLMFVIT